MKFPFAFSNYKESNLVIQSFFVNQSEENILNNLRKISNKVEPIDIKNKRNYFEKLKIYDAGNFKIKYYDEIYEKTLENLKNGKFTLNIFIPHLFSLYSIGICSENDGILIFDAHADLKDTFEKEKYHRATWLRRLLELIDEDKVMIIGLRSLDEDELNFIEENKISYLTSFEIEENLRKSLRKIKNFTQKFEKIYISFDVDVLDYSYVDYFYPESFGLNMFQIYEILDNINSKIAGIDFCEFNIIDENKAINTVNLLFKLISLFKNNI